MLKRRIRSDDVVDYLIDAILWGDFKPGAKIVELHAAKLLGVSQATVREAFHELKVKGFLESSPFKGTYVRRFTAKGLKDYFRTRTEIELLAARWSSEQDWRSMDWDGLEEYIEKMERYIGENNHIFFRKTDMEFHHAIVSGCESPSLVAAWEALNHSFWAYFGIYLEQQNYSLNKQVEMHRSILESLRKGEFEELRKKLAGHYVDISAVLDMTERETD
jgi:DNA-binding GntR family transcriptional regulator